MQFQSADFIVFLCVVVFVYWRLGRRGQNLVLIGSSCLFYGYVHPWFLGLLFASALTDYACSQGIRTMPSRRTTFLVVSLCVNLGILATFKYLDFFVVSVASVLDQMGMAHALAPLRLILPVGVSFYTFQTMSYTIDVYRGRLSADHRFIDYLLFISFFPQLVAGPIERADRLLPQLEQERRFDAAMFRDGLMLMAWGFFKKLVIADSVAVTAEKVFALEHPSFHLLWAGVFAFSIQIYADFSAYTDIARGSSRLLGITLVENFRHPYLSRSPPEFWRRWHITLSEWFRDYVFIPLGGSRVSTGRWAFNILAVFALSGLWHGASWNFIIWGLYWGALIVAHRALVAVTPAWVRRAPAMAPVSVAAMGVLAMIGWLMFRETEWSALVRDFTLSPMHTPDIERKAAIFLVLHTAVLAVPLALHAAVDAIWPPTTPSRPRLVIKTVAALLCLVGICVLRSTSSADFIYFQF